jgi:hypothetical protein
VAAALDGSGSAFWFMDQAGAMKGYATGEPVGALAADLAWQLGVDVAAVSRHADAYQLLGYARDPERLRADLTAYRGAVAGDVPLRCALRPGRPDCSGPANLAAKLDALAEREVAGADFYHYGLLPLPAVAMVRDVLARR